MNINMEIILHYCQTSSDCFRVAGGASTSYSKCWGKRLLQQVLRQAPPTTSACWGKYLLQQVLKQVPPTTSACWGKYLLQQVLKQVPPTASACWGKYLLQQVLKQVPPTASVEASTSYNKCMLRQVPPTESAEAEEFASSAIMHACLSTVTLRISPNVKCLFFLSANIENSKSLLCMGGEWFAECIQLQGSP